jgi:hypothetical protein
MGEGADGKSLEMRDARLPLVGGFPYGRGLSPLVGSTGYLRGKR